MATKAVIIGTSDVIRLCTARAVGAAGYDVDIVRIGRNRGKYLKTPDYYCKYVGNYYYYDETSPVSLPDFLVDKYRDSDQKPVLFTLGDKITHIIDEDRIHLADFFLFAHLKDGGSLSELMDKHYMKSLAASAGLSVVEGWPVIFNDGEFSIPDNLRFPCYVKGLYSYWDSKPIQRKCNDRAELVALTQFCKSVYPHSLYAEEFVESRTEMGMMGVCDGENCIIPAETDLVLMAEGASHGVSILGRVKPVREDRTIASCVGRLLQKMGYVGIFNIDFIETKDQCFFVELNLRYATYGYGIFKSGVNFPALFIDILHGTHNPHFVSKIDCGHTYLNEEVALESVIEGKLSMSKYKEIEKQADFHFVQNSGDPRPMRHLKIRFGIKCLLTLKKRIGRKGRDYDN